MRFASRRGILAAEMISMTPPCANIFRKVFRRAAELCAYLCRLYGLSERDIITHCEGYRLGIASNHADVMHWFETRGKHGHFSRFGEAIINGIRFFPLFIMTKNTKKAIKFIDIRNYGDIIKLTTKYLERIEDDQKQLGEKMAEKASLTKADAERALDAC